MCYEKIKDFEDEVLARTRPINTRMLQLSSLYDFANELGYIVLGTDTCQGFYNPKVPRDGLKFISFDTMKHYHNNPFNDYTFSSEMSIAAAANARIVERVKLQRTKNGIKAQNHYIKLITDSREDFLKSELAKVCPTLTGAQLEILANSDLIK